MSETMHPRLDELLFTVQDVSFVPASSPPDFANHYLTTASSRSRMSTSMPSPGVIRSYVEARHQVNSKGQTVLVGKVAHDLTQEMKQIMKDLPDQVSHRSRPGTLMSGKLQVNEFRKRIAGQQSKAKDLKENQIPISTSWEIKAIKWQALKKRLTVDMDHIRAYISDHKDSSIIPGLKWSQLPTENPNWWRAFLAVARATLETAYESKEALVPNVPFFLGSRQRPDQQAIPGVSEYDLEVVRSRVVNFHPAFSAVFALVPDKKGYYTEVFEAIVDLFDISDHVLFPPVHGGAVYTEFADMLMNRESGVVVLSDDLNVIHKGDHYGFDGSNWETSCGVLLNDGLASTKTSFGGGLHIPSGVYDTSLDGTITNLWLYANHKDDLITGHSPIPEILELEPTDTRTNFMLGWRYSDDPTHPRLQGAKLAVDNATKTVALPQGRGVLTESSYSDLEREAWCLAYYGETLDGGSVLDYLTDIDGNDWVNPSRLLYETVVNQQSLDTQ